MGGALAAPATAYIYDWNILPIGQVLWLKELETYQAFPPLQDPASYNLSQVYERDEEGQESAVTPASSRRDAVASDRAGVPWAPARPPKPSASNAFVGRSG